VRGAFPTPPTTADLDYHVSTLFPPVRPHGHMEVRYVDGQPGNDWTLPTAVIVALLHQPQTVDRVLELCEPARGRWVSGARHGLADRVLARAAAGVFTLACERLDPGPVRDRLVDVTEGRVLRGQCPADLPEPEPETPEGHPA
jgi:glutamate--cysteine ligase